MAKVSVPKGTRDFLPADLNRRRFLTDKLTQLFEAYGFEPLETPAFEHVETLLGKYGGDEKLIFKILKRGEEGRSGEADLALRYDLTVPLARVVAMYSELPRPFKRYQIAPVWRAERPQKGRFREFYQCDVDVAGSTSPLVEVEILSMKADLFASLGFQDAVVQLNHRQVLAGFIHAAGIAPERGTEVLVALDKLDKIGLEGVVGELQGLGLAEDSLAHLRTVMALSGTNDALLEAMTGLVGDFQPALEGLANLRTILDGVRGAGVPEGKVKICPVLARGLGYYTGAIWEVTIEGYGGSMGGGGRYDNLVGMFSGRNVPACGTSFGLARIQVIMEERGLLQARATTTQVLLPFYALELRDPVLALAASLRGEGLRVDVYPDPGRLGPQLQYGTTRGIPFAAILGPDELAKGVVTVRNLVTRDQVSLPQAEVASWLKAALAGV